MKSPLTHGQVVQEIHRGLRSVDSRISLSPVIRLDRLTEVRILLRSVLLGVSPLDPVAFLGVVLAMVGMILAGKLAPARRAASVDPAEALRYD